VSDEDVLADEIDAIAAHHDDMGGRMGRRGGHRGFGHRGMGGMLGIGAIERLDLTADQREKLVEIRDREQRKAIESRAQLETAGLDLRKLMRAESPSQTQINGQIDRIARMRADLQKSRVGAMIEARGLLTADQRAKLKEARTARPAPAPRPEDAQ
jgi:Spy/CpxP family protein refolding chaperone